MPKKADVIPLIQTKLHRPPLPVDMVRRPRLTKWLRQHQSRPLTLVSAPAGYGKSTLISCWLSYVDCPTAWISLDEHDNQLNSFLSYFVGAIQTIFPRAIPETQSFLTTTPKPSIGSIAHTLINELNQIGETFILVLDDYHCIESQEVHDLLNEILTHPPSNLHLVLSTRMDPLLPLVTLRAKNQLTEVRIQDLRFTDEETRQLFRKMIDAPDDLQGVSEMNAQAEGWVTGLRLAALARRHRVGWDSSAEKLVINNHYLTEYLLAEILAKQSSSMSECMLKTSILDRFCADLCEALCFPETVTSNNQSGAVDINGNLFLEWLQASNLFVIPLDDQHKWYRYHHLFKEFLLQELARRFGQAQIRQLHALAGHWYAQNGWVDEALNHFLAANATTSAIALIEQHRYRMMNTTQWPRLERWLSSFSAEVIETSPELWMLKTWLAYHSGQWAEIPASITHLDTILAERADPGIAQRLAGEISSLRGLVAYHRGDFERTIFYSSQALELVPPELWIVRAFARMHLGGGLLLKGDVASSYQAFYSSLETEKEQSKPFKATVLTLACYFHWITADLIGLEQASKKAVALCLEADYRQILGLGRYHLGCVHYQQNDLIAAEALFAWVVERPYQNYGTCYVNSVCGLAFTYQAQGKEDEARQVVETAIAFLLETGNLSQMPMILALQAEIALSQDHLSTAIQWTNKLDPLPPLAPMPWFFTLHLTLVKVWLAQSTLASQAQAADLLNQLQEYLTKTHNTRFLIDTMALQALLADTIGDQATARAALEKSLRLAQPGGFVRVFVDLGPQMANLLSRLKIDRGMQTYIRQIQAAFPEHQGTETSLSQELIAESLTNRELQVLELLEQRLTNQEIADQMTITVGTVKGHTVQIYEKLGVKGRRQAVEKAIKLGILASQ